MFWADEILTVMITRFRPLRALCVLLLATVAFGQRALLLSDEYGAAQVVVGARGLSPVIIKDGERVAVESNCFGLSDKGSFIYSYVTVRDTRSGIARVEDPDVAEGESIYLHLSCELEAPQNLDDVFIVIEVDGGGTRKALNLFEVGKLRAGRPKKLSAKVPVKVAPEKEQIQFLLFSGGKELFHSLMSDSHFNELVDAAIEEKVQGVDQASPRPLVGPAPEYPKSLKKKQLEGLVVFTLNIDGDGRVTEAIVTDSKVKKKGTEVTKKRAEDVSSVSEEEAKAFADAALKVIRKWRFLPKISEGKAVKTQMRFALPFILPNEA